MHGPKSLLLLTVGDQSMKNYRLLESLYTLLTRITRMWRVWLVCPSFQAMGRLVLVRYLIFVSFFEFVGSRFCSGVVVLRMRPSVTRDFGSPFSQSKHSVRSRVALSPIRKTTTPLQNRSRARLFTFFIMSSLFTSSLYIVKFLTIHRASILQWCCYFTNAA